MKDCVIPNRASLLTHQLFQTLSPLIKSQDIPARDPLDQLVTVWSGEQARLTAVFKLALQIKTSLLISTDLYRCVYHPPWTYC